MGRAGLKKVVKTAKGGVRRTYYVKSNPKPFRNLHAVKAKGGSSAAAKGAKIGAFAGAVIGGAMGTVGGAVLGGAVRHSNFTNAVRTANPWAGVGGNDPRLHIAMHKPGMIAGHYAGGVALGGAAGGVAGAVGGSAVGAALGAAAGRAYSAIRGRATRSSGLRNQGPSGPSWVPWSERSRETPPNKPRPNTATEDYLVRADRERRSSSSQRRR